MKRFFSLAKETVFMGCLLAVAVYSAFMIYRYLFSTGSLKLPF